MQIVANKTHMDPKTGGQGGCFRSYTPVFRVVKLPKGGDAGEVDRLATGQYPRAQTVFCPAKTLGKNRRLVRFAIAVGIHYPTNPFGLSFVFGKLIACSFNHHGPTIANGSTGQIIIEPIHMAANVRNTGMNSKAFHDIGPTLVIDGKGDGIGQMRFRGKDRTGIPGRNLKACDGFLRLLGGGFDIHLGIFRPGGGWENNQGPD